MRSPTASTPCSRTSCSHRRAGNLAWSSSIPGPALLAWPLTATIGAVPAYNILALLAPALAAWCAFLLCRELRTGTAAALAGGLVFGFTAYQAAETLSHLNLALVFTLPLCGLVVARHLRGAISDRRFVALLALCILGVFATFLETLFWATLGGAFALCLGLAFTRGAERALLVRCLQLSAFAYVIALAIAAPYLWIALAHPDPLTVSGQGYQLDLANLLVPTDVTALRPLPLHDVARHLGGENLTEQLGYVGPVLPVLAGIALWERRREPLARVLAVVIAAAAVVALGARLVVAGHHTGVPLPWSLFDGLPLASHALTARAFVLAWLALAILTAFFLRSANRVRWLWFAVMALTLMPNPNGQLWVTRLDRPALFEQQRWRSLVQPGENVLLIPFGFGGDAMFWQQEADFGFATTGGYVGPTVPPALWRRPIVLALYGGPLPPSPGRAFRDLARDRDVDVVLLRSTWPGPWRKSLGEAFGPPRTAGGMLAWRVRGSWPEPASG